MSASDPKRKSASGRSVAVVSHLADVMLRIGYYDTKTRIASKHRQAIQFRHSDAICGIDSTKTPAK